jgi:glycosyltransferase involved in cell wall biosynthesis
VIWTDHADLKYVYQNGSVWYKNPIGKLVYWLSQRVRAVILVSENEKGHITESLQRPAPHNYVVIYNGVSSAEITPAKRSAKDKGAIIFTATSRLVTAKGIGELVEAFHNLRLERDDVRLWLFGEGPEAERFKALAEGDERIVFWGFPDDAMSHVAASDVFVHPSYHEGFSISLIEAAKLGLPIIACNVGGNPEIVSDGVDGLLIAPRDAAALLHAMQSLADDKGVRERYGQAARKVYEDSFVWENIVKEKYVPLYE